MPTDHTDQSDAMIARLEGELEERNAFNQGLIAAAQEASRDLSDNETELIQTSKARIDNINAQLKTLVESRSTMIQAREKAREYGQEMMRLRREVDTGPVEYRSTGAYLVDYIAAQTGSKSAMERLELFTRAAAHQKTSDNLGVIPDPIVGDVVNFIDAARPIVSATGPRDMPSATWHRPKVTQHTTVGVQGTAGAAADEKTELLSQKMTITRLTGNAVTYGGYVNVSRQNIDFSSPSALDAVVNDLAAQYAVETEAAAAAELATTGTTAVTYPNTGLTNDDVAGAVWEAVAVVYAAVKGQGRVIIAVAPDVLGIFGPLFAPVNPQNAQSAGFTAGGFSQGVMGAIGGVPVVMSAGLGTGEAFAFSTAAFEVYEQRVGQLQATEPSVLGVQVAYAGYFTPLTIEAAGIVPISEAV
jgi:HK97 family phage major capsid protein